MQLTSYDRLTPNNINFKDAKDYQVKNSSLKYERIKIETVYPDGKKGDLVIETPFLFSFGASEKKNQETNKLILVCLWAKDSEPTPREQEFFVAINDIVDICRQGEYSPELASSLSSPFYYKQIEYTDKKGKKKTKIDPSAAPVLYTKLIYSEKSKKILSLFRTKGNKDLNLFKYINQYCNVRMAFIIEGIFIIKTVVSLQIKVNECYVKPLKPRQFLLTIDEESDEEQVEKNESEASEEDNESDTEEVVEDLVISDKEVTE